MTQNPENQFEQRDSFQGRFQPSQDRLEEIAKRGTEIAENATEDDLGEFTEHPSESL